MSDVGDDILEALQDVGMEIEIIHSGESNVSGEYAIIKANRQVTKAFIQEFFREATLAYNTVVVPGDVLRVAEFDENYLVTSQTPTGFENEIISYQSFLYKCNVVGVGVLKRYPSGEVRDDNYLLAPEFETIRSECYALVTEGLFGHGIEEDEELGRLGLENNECYMPTLYDPRLEDRFEPVSGEYYIVQSVKKRKFHAVAVLELKEDTR